VACPSPEFRARSAQISFINFVFSGLNFEKISQKYSCGAAFEVESDSRKFLEIYQDCGDRTYLPNLHIYDRMGAHVCYRVSSEHDDLDDLDDVISPGDRHHLSLMRTMRINEAAARARSRCQRSAGWYARRS
jgi:hypothetical protein